MAHKWQRSIQIKDATSYSKVKVEHTKILSNVNSAIVFDRVFLVSSMNVYGAMRHCRFQVLNIICLRPLSQRSTDQGQLNLNHQLKHEISCDVQWKVV